MRPFSILSFGLLAGIAAAAPTSAVRKGKADCMTADEAKFMVEIYRRLIAEYKPEEGEKYTTKDFVDVSDSINTFIHRPLGGPTFPTKAVFLEVQLQNPPFPINILSVDAVTCDTIALQWTASFGAAMLPSKGLTIMKLAKEDSIWKIKKIDVEFNALTWLLNMGGSYSWEDETYTPEKPDPGLKAKPM
jgi:hypothetical protein